ncbi:MAG: cytochrome-c oxidase [Betaproteobacteria bacterium]
MNLAATANPPLVQSFTPGATTWLKLSVIYLIVGIAIGIGMGATENFTLRPVHAHLNLLGWTTFALAGLIYAVYPDAAKSRLARIHFWLHNAAVPVMMASLAVFLLGNPKAVPFLVASEFVAAAGVIVFAFNVFINVKPARTASA